MPLNSGYLSYKPRQVFVVVVVVVVVLYKERSFSELFVYLRAFKL
jgi:hypothetical protein